jgi:hypothetical protein
MLSGLCAGMHTEKRLNGWLLSRGIKGSQRISRRISRPDGSPSASLSRKYCHTRSCWLCKDNLRLFRHLGPVSRAASILHPYPMQKFKYLSPAVAFLFIRNISMWKHTKMNACNRMTYQGQHSSMGHAMWVQRQCSAHRISWTFHGKRCSHRNQ